MMTTTSTSPLRCSLLYRHIATTTTSEDKQDVSHNQPHLESASMSTTTGTTAVSVSPRTVRILSWDCLSEDINNSSDAIVRDAASCAGIPKAWFPHNSCEVLPATQNSPKASTSPINATAVSESSTNTKVSASGTLGREGACLPSLQHHQTEDKNLNIAAASLEKGPIVKPPSCSTSMIRRHSEDSTSSESSFTPEKLSDFSLDKRNGVVCPSDAHFTPIHRKVDHFNELLDLSKLICVSATSKLYWGSLSSNDLPVVVKIVPRASHTVLECQQIQREFEALSFLHEKLSLEWRARRRKSLTQIQCDSNGFSSTTFNRNPADAIVKPIALLETKDEIAFVSERLEGPDLCQYLIGHEKGKLSESEARELIRILLDVLGAIHSLGFVHRDIKLPNLVLKDKKDLSSVTLVDFGFAARHNDIGEMCRCCGSPGSCAPEILLGQPNRHGGRIDVFSVGVVLYTLLTGMPPFYANCPIVILRLNCRAELNFDDPIWSSLSSGAKDFVMQLTQRLPEDRLSISEAQTHPWMAVV